MSTDSTEFAHVFSQMARRNHEQVVFCQDESTGLKAIIAIHDTTLGPALGGCRMWHYDSEADALRDVLRLSRGMTYKSAAAGLNLGGGKAVIIGASKTQKNEMLFRPLRAGPGWALHHRRGRRHHRRRHGVGAHGERPCGRHQPRPRGVG